MTLVMMLVFITAFVLLWYAIKGETPQELIKRAFGTKGKAK